MITININGLTLCHKGSGGVSHNTLPDVCKTPGEGTPVPYENEAYSADLVKGTVSVFADGGNMIANMGSQFARSVFDEQGSMGGVKSGTNKAEAEWISHSFDVFFEGKPACRLTDKMFMNHRNTVNMAGEQQPCLAPCPVLEEKSRLPPPEDKNKDKEPAMPCIVILVHGVNDVGEAYQNQDEGLCRGLNRRLGRNDLQPHTWQSEKHMISDVEGKVARSPVIPFYWGYKPVEHSEWEKDQKRYRDELDHKHDDTDLAYDTYQQDDKNIIHAHADESIDNLNNWLDKECDNTKGGGTFANATTNIPDMFGPGANGFALGLVGEFSRSFMNEGDWSHPIYNNPHRIYQAYAARRLADLIIAIRQNKKTETDTINIVAHSQGTIITMLANMWVKAEGFTPADCVILNHSPYSLENRWLENAQPGNQQTDAARQQTLAHFCALMAQNSLYQQGAGSHTKGYIQKLTDTGCLSPIANWDDPQFNRNNFGMVYNYFCPNDHVVSMTPIQGFGWRGVPDKIRAGLGHNFWQRVYCKGITVGDKNGYHFSMPEKHWDDPDIPATCEKYSYSDVTINAPTLPMPFVFLLQAQASGYKTKLAGNDPAICRAAIKAEYFKTESVDLPDKDPFRYLHDGQVLNASQLNELKITFEIEEPIRGVVQGDYGPGQKANVTRYLTNKELEEMMGNTVLSQHSSIVGSKYVPEMAMTFDLAIGECKAFEDTEFWRDLLLRADWRREKNPDAIVKKYYQQGFLPPNVKPLMNKPERPHGMPSGEYGVVNDYGPRTRKESTGTRDINGKPETVEKTVLQWDMPKPLV